MKIIKRRSTGLYDFDNVEVLDKDILTLDGDYKNTWLCYWKIDEDRFVIRKRNCKTEYIHISFSSGFWRVVGNIKDNHELFKERKAYNV